MSNTMVETKIKMIEKKATEIRNLAKRLGNADNFMLFKLSPLLELLVLLVFRLLNCAKTIRIPPNKIPISNNLPTINICI
jgi:hypothetical protein